MNSVFTAPPTHRLVRRKELRALLGNVSDSTIERWIISGKIKPPIEVMEGSRSVAWPSAYVEALVAKRAAAFDEREAA